MSIIHESFTDISLLDDKFFDSFKNLKSYEELKIAIEKMSKSYSDFDYKEKVKEYNIDYNSMSVDEIIKASIYKFKGDLFEIFAEGFFNLLGNNPTIGVDKYEPVLSKDDYGVDGFGLGIDNKPLTVQIKYRTDPTTVLLERDIKQFPYQSIKTYGVDINTNKNLVIFTNCNGINWRTKEIFYNQLRVIDIQKISTLLYNNNPFWNNFSKLIEESKP